MPIALDEFSKQVVGSGLLTAAELDAFLTELPAAERPPDSQALARELVRRKKLTQFQAREIYRGQGRSLVMGNYVILDKLGEGGMGMVFRAEHRRMRRVVALKVLATRFVDSPAALARFHREVEAAAKLIHPHIVTAFDADESGGTHFLVMQFVEGSDLSSLVRKRGPLPVAQALDCIRQTAQGLEFAHQHGVIHRDIKPANLLLDREGAIRILDMGLARIESTGNSRADELTGTGQIMGTVDFMAPEQAVNTKKADQRADLYSLGMTLWFLLTGRAAYDGETVMEKLLAHREQPVPDLIAACPQASPALAAVFRRMVAKQPADRHASMTELLAELDALNSQSVPAAPLAGDDALHGFLRNLGQGADQASPPDTLSLHAPAEDTNAQTLEHVSTSAAADDARPAPARSNQRLLLAGAGGSGTLLLLALGAYAGGLFTAHPTIKPVAEVKSPAGNGAATGAVGTTTNLLTQLDFAQAAIEGDWRRDGGALVSPVLPYAQLQLPGPMPPAYRLSLEVVRQAGQGAIVVGLPCDGSRAVVTFEARPPRTTLGDCQGSTAGQTLSSLASLVPGRTTKIECEVRPDLVRVAVDGQEALRYAGDLKVFHVPGRWQAGDPQVPFLGASLVRIRVTRIDLTPL